MYIEIFRLFTMRRFFLTSVYMCITYCIFGSTSFHEDTLVCMWVNEYKHKVNGRWMRKSCEWKKWYSNSWTDASVLGKNLMLLELKCTLHTYTERICDLNRQPSGMCWQKSAVRKDTVSFVEKCLSCLKTKTKKKRRNRCAYRKIPWGLNGSVLYRYSNQTRPPLKLVQAF